MIATHEYFAATHYTAPVDFKKLAFIHQAVAEQAKRLEVAVADLRILEVACGDGGITVPLASLGCTVRAFDLDAAAAAATQQRAAAKGLSNLTVTADDGFTFYDGTAYDLVVVSEVVNQVSEPDRFIGNIARSVREGGSLIITLPNGYGPWQVKNRFDPRNWLRKSNLLRAALGRRRYTQSLGVDSCHYFTKNRLIRLFETHALHFLRMANSDSIFAMSQVTRKNRALGSLDAKMADILPYWAASGWYFCFQKRSVSDAAV